MSNGNNYTLPLGIDAKEFFAGLEQMDKGLGDLQTSGKSAAKGISEAFVGTVSAGEKAEAALGGATEKLQLLRDAARAVGKDLGEALGGKTLEDKIAKFQTLMAKATKGGKVDLGITFNEATIKELQRGLAGASKEIDHFRTLVAAAKVQLASLDPASADFSTLSEQIAITEGFIEGLGEAEVETEGKSKSLRAQLREMKQELALMEEAGHEGTQAFLDLSVNAGKLEDQLGDTSQRVRVLASDTRHIDAAIQGVTGLVGAMTAAQGASTLFGSDNEELAKSLQKVTAAMAILQGIQAVAQTLNKDSAFSILFLSKARIADATAAGVETVAIGAETVATEAATVATVGFTAALLSNPITIIVVAIVAAAAALYAFTKNNDDASESVARLTRALEDEKKILDLDIAGIRARAELAAATASLRKNSEQEVIKIQGKALQTELAYNDAAVQSARDKLNSIRGFSEEENKARETANKTIEDGDAKHNDLVNQINLKGVEQQKQIIEDRRKMRDEVLQFTKELQAAELAGANDRTIQQRARNSRVQAREETEQKIADLKREILLSAEAEGLRNKTIAALRVALSKRLKDIARQEQKDISDLQIAGTRQTLDLLKEGQEDLEQLRQIELNQLSVDNQAKTLAIVRDFEGQTKIQNTLLDALGDSMIRKTREINLKYRIDTIKQQQEIQTAALAIAYGFKELPARVEQLKQQDLLKIQIQGAEARVQALLASGKKETDVAVLTARAEVIAIQAELERNIRTGRKFTSLFDLLGLEGDGGLTPSQVSAIQEGVGQIANAYKSVLDFQLAANQQSIDSSTQKINAFQTEIDALQATLDKEDDLRRKGYANNAAQAKKDLETKKQQQADEIQARHEAFEKQKAIQRQQLILDSISQGSSLITASANVIEGFTAAFPVIGAGLGLAAVAAMIVGFIATKAQAFAAINNQKESFAEGGFIDGPSHAGGGTKYRSADGSSVKELEGGEHVTRKSQAAKWGELLEAINHDRIGELSDRALGQFLAGTGVTFATDIPEAGSAAGRELDLASSRFFVLNNGSSGDDKELKGIREDVGYLADRKRDEVESWEDATYFYEKKGQVTTKIRKR